MVKEFNKPKLIGRWDKDKRYGLFATTYSTERRLIKKDNKGKFITWYGKKRRIK